MKILKHICLLISSLVIFAACLLSCSNATQNSNDLIANQNTRIANSNTNQFDEFVLSESGRQAYQTLLKIDLFAIGGTGEGGETSNGEKALDILTKDKKAIAALKSLVKTSTSEGGLYALLGLKILNCDCFKEELTNYKNLPESFVEERNQYGKIDKGNVNRMEGCKLFQESRLKVVNDIENGENEMVEWKLSHPDRNWSGNKK